MGIETAIVSAILSSLQLIILVVAGIVLTKLGPLDRQGEMKFALGNYYLFLPFFSAVEIARATDLDSIANLGLLLMNFFINSAITLLLTLIYCHLSKMDVRTINSFVMIAGFGNIALYPSVIVDSMCGDNGLFEGDDDCDNGYGFCVFGIFMINTVIWAAGPYFLVKDKCIELGIRRQMCLIKQVYNSPKDFMNDEDFSILNKVTEENLYSLVNDQNNNEEKSTTREKLTTESNQHTNGQVKIPDNELIEHPEICQYSNQIYMSCNVYNQFLKKYEEFTKKVKPELLAKMNDKLPKLTEPPKTTCKVLLSRVITPPVVACVIGVILGLITPVKDAFFSSLGKQIFMKTFTNIGAITLPIANMLLGCKLSSGFIFSEGMLLRIKDLIAIIVIRHILLPFTGLGYIKLLMKIGISQITESKIFSFIMYSYWFVPPSVLFISLFVMLKHYMKEIALLQFWTNVLTAGTTPIFIIGCN